MLQKIIMVIRYWYCQTKNEIKSVRMVLSRPEFLVVLHRGVPYPVPFVAIARDGSNFPGKKMSALLLSIPQWDRFY